MKRKLSLLLVLTMLIGMITLTGCGKEAGNLIGVAMPTQSLQRWNQDGENMKKELEAKGYKVDLQFANNDVNLQIQQLENMISKGCKVLVIASIDGSSLTDVLKKAADQKIRSSLTTALSCRPNMWTTMLP